MKCPHCGMEVERDEKKCPYCYGVLECGDPDNCDDEQREHGHDTFGDHTRTYDDDFDAAHPSAPKKASKGKSVTVISALAIFLAALFIIGLTVGMLRRNDNPVSGPGTYTSGDIHPDRVVAEYDGTALFNRDFNYYFWSDFYSHYNTYGDSVFDTSMSLFDQQYDDDLSWGDYLTEYAMSSWQQVISLANAARAEGFELPDEYKSDVDSLEEQLAEAAEEMEMESAEEYLRSSYSQSADIASFRAFVENNYLARLYYDEVYDRMYDELVTEESTEPTVDVRHILIGLEGEDDAKAKAEEVYKLYLDGEMSEEAFAALANEYSTDPGSNTGGGLYTGVYEGQMVPQFNDWCFDPSRQPGDTDIVETSYGYHIMYFVGEGEPVTFPDETAFDTAFDEWFKGLTGGEPDVDWSLIEVYE